MTRFFPLAALLFLTACGSQGMNLYPYKDPGFSREKFAVCHGFNCYYRTEAWITDKQWAGLKKIFTPPAKTPDIERQRIAKAIGRMETYAGLSSGLNEDRAEAETFEENRITQMDCIDETVNTDMYLNFLADAGLLVHHNVVRPVHRGFFIDGAWPHNAAAVRDKESGAVYVVDSYYGAHGRDAYIVPLPEWADFWRPVGARRGPKAEDTAPASASASAKQSAPGKAASGKVDEAKKKPATTSSELAKEIRKEPESSAKQAKEARKELESGSKQIKGSKDKKTSD